MQEIKKIKRISIWIFIIPFIAVNLCLLIVTNFHQILPQIAKIGQTFPYIVGGISISRAARFFPTYLIFKPSMFVTAYLLFIYWRSNFKLLQNFNVNKKFLHYFLFFGISSAICLVLHSIFLGVKFDFDLYKIFRRAILLLFIIFEIAAQTYLVITLYRVKYEIKKYINENILKFKIVLVSILIITALISLPFVIREGNIAFKHILEWDYFLGVILFYFLTFMMWKKENPIHTPRGV